MFYLIIYYRQSSVIYQVIQIAVQEVLVQCFPSQKKQFNGRKEMFWVKEHLEQ